MECPLGWLATAISVNKAWIESSKSSRAVGVCHLPGTEPSLEASGASNQAPPVNVRASRGDVHRETYRGDPQDRLAQRLDPDPAIAAANFAGVEAFLLSDDLNLEEETALQQHESRLREIENGFTGLLESDVTQAGDPALLESDLLLQFVTDIEASMDPT